MTGTMTKAARELEANWFSSGNITQKFEITADMDTMQMLERFFAFLHFNGGHSGTFAMSFDGDGHQHLSVSPPPDKRYNKAMHAIGGSGADVEIAVPDGFLGRYFDDERGFYFAPDGDKETIVKKDKNGDVIDEKD